MAGYEICARAQDCCEQFELLLRIKEEIGVTDEAEDNSHDVTWIQDQFARFKMWAGNIGAFAEGHASLDYRLRDSDETKQLLLDFLASLGDLICTGELLRALLFHFYLREAYEDGCCCFIFDQC